MQSIVHYALHLAFPLVIARLAFREDWRRAYLLLLATMLVDMDHLVADPIFQADRCSIQYHSLHTWPAMIGYIGLLLWRGTGRILGVGLLWHMATDFIDCMMTYARCGGTCLADSPIIGLLRALAGLLGGQ